MAKPARTRAIYAEVVTPKGVKLHVLFDYIAGSTRPRILAEGKAYTFVQGCPKYVLTDAPRSSYDKAQQKIIGRCGGMKAAHEYWS